jgi:hypothetical protein
MNHPYAAIASLLFGLTIFGHQAADAGTPVGQVTQLSGFVMTVKANGALKVLSSQSIVEVGDTLVSEENTYIRLSLADGRQVVFGPQTRLEFTNASRLNLATGQLQVLAAASPGATRLTIVAGETTVDTGTASFNLFYRPDPAAALARHAYARASLALAFSPVQSDAGTALPIWEQVATTFIPQYIAPSAGIPSKSTGSVLPQGLAPGLYVQVIDGAINMSNAGGSLNFSAGQFGFTPSMQQPPIIVPNNPGLKFTPPPSFSSPVNATSTGVSTGVNSSAVDCEVR